MDGKMFLCEWKFPKLRYIHEHVQYLDVHVQYLHVLSILVHVQINPSLLHVCFNIHVCF